MKTIEDLINELSYSMPYDESDLKRAYRLGQINLLLDLARNAKGYVINGLMRGAVTEEELTAKLVEIEND
jgi:hypothetical protein